MEKSNPDGESTKKHGDGTPPADQPPLTTPRSKLKTLRYVAPERSYKEMLQTTSHIYQSQTAGSVCGPSGELHVSCQSTQTDEKQMPVREGKICPSSTILREGITVDVPISKIISRDQPISSPLVNSDDTAEIPNIKDNTEYTCYSENGAETEESSAQHTPTENGFLDHEGENELPEVDGVAVSCRKHSTLAENKPRTLTGRPKLCESCTVSMLSYIAMLQDMIDVVTNEITADPEDHTPQCPECVKEKILEKYKAAAPAPVDQTQRRDVSKRPRDLPLTKQSKAADQMTSRDFTSRLRGIPTTKGEQPVDQHAPRHAMQHRQRAVSLPSGEISDSVPADSRISTAASPGDAQDAHTSQRLLQKETAFAQAVNGESESDGIHEEQPEHAATKPHIPSTPTSDSMKRTDVLKEDRRSDERSVSDGVIKWDRNHAPLGYTQERESHVLDHSETPDYISDRGETFFPDSSVAVHPATMNQRSWQENFAGDGGHKESVPATREDFRSQASPHLLDHEGSDGILSALSNEEREVYDSARGGAGWERLTDSQEYRDTSFGPHSTDEAFVTMATTNAEAISCLVLGSSLQLCRTTRTSCVLITDGVSPSLKAPLASVFQVVQSVRSLDTVGTTKVALLDQPDLGIFFRKLHAWRLVQFSKCVFLNPDTLMVQNSDELFFHEELSAVPDIGWPDCFNSGVFVFQPSLETFWKLVEFAESEGSYDGGDQGLLNAFFKTWSRDIHKKLSFIYNLMANVSYTYTPAFKQFGRNVKIVQFQGPFKPWHVKFYTKTGQIAPSTSVHPTFVQFVHVWLNIFRVRVLPLFPQDIQAYASNRNIISASELLKFYPSPIEIEADFLLTPPSVRIRPDPPKIVKRPPIMRRHSIGSYKELRRDQEPRDQEVSEDGRPSELPQSDQSSGVPVVLEDTSKHTEEIGSLDAGEPALAPAEEEPSPSEKTSPSVPGDAEDATTGADMPASSEEDEESRRSSIPGSEIGDYQGMAAWEQGRMDYMGTASSENIIKRLHFLMEKPSDADKLE